jgi:hypothetical protein
LIERTILLVRATAATRLILFLVGWSDAFRARDKSFAGDFVLGLLIAVYLWLTLFSQGRREEAIGSCIGLIAGVLAIYTSKLGLIFVLGWPVSGADMVRLRKPVAFGHCARCLGAQLSELPTSENCVSNACCTRRRGILACVVVQLAIRRIAERARLTQTSQTHVSGLDLYCTKPTLGVGPPSGISLMVPNCAS